MELIIADHRKIYGVEGSPNPNLPLQIVAEGDREWCDHIRDMYQKEYPNGFWQIVYRMERYQ